MSKSYYSGAVKAKRQSLADYFEQISSALDEINKISIADSWDCTNAKDASISLEDLKSKIGSIKTCMNSYLSFFGVG